MKSITKIHRIHFQQIHTGSCIKIAITSKNPIPENRRTLIKVTTIAPRLKNIIAHEWKAITQTICNYPSRHSLTRDVLFITFLHYTANTIIAFSTQRRHFGTMRDVIISRVFMAREKRFYRFFFHWSGCAAKSRNGPLDREPTKHGRVSRWKPSVIQWN